MQTLAEIIGMNIRTRREALGLSQNKLARRVGIHPNMIGYYALGKFFPQLDTLAAICDALDVSADWLMGRVDEDA